MATETKAPKTSIKKSPTSGQSATTSTMKAGLGMFKGKIVSESSAWADDLRVTIKKWTNIYWIRIASFGGELIHQTYKPQLNYSSKPYEWILRQP